MSAVAHNQLRFRYAEQSLRSLNGTGYMTLLRVVREIDDRSTGRFRDVRICDDIAEPTGVAFSLEVDESLLTPIRIPRIADNPVIVAPVITDQLHAVIEFVGVAGARVSSDRLGTSPL